MGVEVGLGVLVGGAGVDVARGGPGVRVIGGGGVAVKRGGPGVLVPAGVGVEVGR
jgi:hypothetical protein